MSLHARIPAARRLANVLHGRAIVRPVVLSLCLTAAVWVSILVALSAQRADALRGAGRTIENLTRVFEEHTIRTVSALDQSLLSLRRGIARDRDGFDIVEWAGSTRSLTEITTEFAVTDPHGIVLSGTLTPPGVHTDLSDRPHFRALRDRPGDSLFIGAPLIGRSSGRPTLVLARKVIAPDGGFGGIALAALNPDYLSRFYATVDLGRLSAVRLVGLDGITRAGTSGGAAINVVGGHPASPADPLSRALAQAPAGAYAGPDPADGVRRLHAYRRIRGLPLAISVGVAESEVLARYRAAAWVQYGLGGALTVLIMALTANHLAQASALRRAYTEARAQYASKSELLEATVGHVRQGILMVGADDRVKVYNQPLIELFGLPAELMANEPPIETVLRWLWEHGEYADPDADFEAWTRRFRASINATGAVQTYEHVRPNGVVLEVRSHALPSGAVVRTYTDITSRTLEARMLRASCDEASAATRAKSAFLATMSHEIRSPLSGLLGVLDLLRATPLAPEQRQMADMIHNSGRMLLGVLNDILDFSKIEAGALSVAPEPVALHALLGEVVQPLVLPARQKGVAVTLSIDPAVPAHVSTDPLRLRQIVGNLLSNALKFTAAGQISVRLDRVADGDAPMLRVVVSDSGIGMDAETIGRLFQPFMQADGSTTRKFGGTGLGLCISHQLAGLLGGTLSATSQPGAGSVFTLLLPCLDCAAAPAPVAAEPAATVKPVHAGRRALLVDDDPTNRWLGQRQLQQLGFDVDVAEDGEAGLAALRASLDAAGYDVVVTDLHMPRLDGIGLTQAVRAAPEAALRRLPIIGLTADTTEEQRRRCHQAGMTALAIKPMTSARLAALLAQLLPASAAGDASPHAPAPGDRAADETAADAPHGLRAVTFDDQIFREIFEPGAPEGAEWLGVYRAAARRKVNALTALLGEAGEAGIDTAEVARLAHRLAGASFSAGAMLTGEAARLLERAAPRAPHAELRRLLTELQAAHALADAAIEAFLADAPIALPALPALAALPALPAAAPSG